MIRLLIMIIFFGVVLTSSAQIKKDCKDFRDGYYYVGKPFHESFIKREGDQQMEIDEFGTILLFDVTWTDNCTYKLSLDSIVNPENHPLDPEWDKDEFIHVNIIKSTPDGYQQLSSTNFTDKNILSEVVRINEEKFNARLRKVNQRNLSKME